MEEYKESHTESKNHHELDLSWRICRRTATLISHLTQNIVQI